MLNGITRGIIRKSVYSERMIVDSERMIVMVMVVGTWLDRTERDVSSGILIIGHNSCDDRVIE